MKKMNRSEWIAVGLSLAFVAFLLYGSTLSNLFGNGINNESQTDQTNQEIDMSTLPETGVKTEDLEVGSGEVAASGDTLTVHYVGTLPTGRVFDSSLDRGEPFSFTLGAGQVIRGWDEGMVGMREGGKRRVMIAPDYGYGAQPVGSIPANSTLIFEVELLEVEKGQ